MSEIAIIGAGAWGTALSIVLGTNGHIEFVFGRTKAKSARALQRAR